MKTKNIINTLFALILLGASLLKADDNGRPELNSAAKDFTLKTLQGKEITLSDLWKEHKVVLIVLRGWPGYQCPICTRQVGEFISYSEEFEKEDAVVLMVYPGPSQFLDDHAEEFVEDTTFPDNFIFTLDPDYTFTNLYGLRWDKEKETAYPSTFILDKKGIVRYLKISDSHGGRSNPEEVLEALKTIN
jgi:peroxiredoxin